jgi:drug/metabolite transporter (DMT)-like permease
MAATSETRAPGPPLAITDIGVFAGTVFIWSTTWIALKLQVSTIDPQVSILWRFLIAAPLMFAVGRIAGARLLFPLRFHLPFVGLGLFFFSVNFILFYNASRFLVSGLLSVIFSFSVVTNIALAALFLGEPIRPRVILGAALGLLGAATLFLPELGLRSVGDRPFLGLALGLLGCLSFSIGNVIATRIRAAGVSAFAANAWGMSYGAAVTAIIALAAGSSFTITATPGYLLSLLWLAIPGSVLVFWMYLVLVGRIGPGRAGYTAVLSPVFALLVSTAFEGYHWTALAAFGLVLVAAGNILILSRGRR